MVEWPVGIARRSFINPTFPRDISAEYQALPILIFISISIFDPQCGSQPPSKPDSRTCVAFNEEGW